MSEKEKSKRAGLRDVPSVDQLLRTDTARELRDLVGIRRLTNIARSVTAEIRTSIQNDGDFVESLLEEAIKRMQASARRESQAGIKPVINATGVLLHTNLGRAPLSEAARGAMNDAARYCSVEYDVESGMRGRRGTRRTFRSPR